jgi:hypothetical protein
MKYTVYFITGYKGHTGPLAWRTLEKNGGGARNLLSNSIAYSHIGLTSFAKFLAIFIQWSLSPKNNNQYFLNER